MELREVFEPIVNFLKNFQRKDKDAVSKEKAKERLQLVLMQDRASVSPDFFEMMKKEIIDVIKKYIEIDEETLEVQLTRGFEGNDGAGPALYANIPIKNIKPVARKIDNVEEETSDNPKEVANTIIEEIKTVSEEKLKDKKDKKDKKKQKDTKENIDEASKEETSNEETKEAENIDKVEENVQEENKEDTTSNMKAKLTGVKEGVADTFSKVKFSAKERFKKIRSKAKAKN